MPMMRRKTLNPARPWYPPALGWPSLAAAVVITWTLMSVLAYFAHQSSTNGGVLFAPSINAIPLRRAFAYRYAPTLVAVLFGVFLVWIDHDAKRFEPYRQMGREGRGVGARDSLLVAYPFEFAPFAPFVAAKRGHWLVFLAASASVLMSFGVVPLQAGLFSTRTIERSLAHDFAVSNAFLHSSGQERSLSLAYAQSAYAILNLNETLPPFTARNYTLRPFTAAGREAAAGESWTANTTLYSMGLQCDRAEAAGERNTTVVMEEEKYYASPNGGPPIKKMENVTYVTLSDAGFNSSTGCYVPHARLNNNTEGAKVLVNGEPVEQYYRKYSTDYKGWSSPSLATGSISGNLRSNPACGDRGNHTFFALFTQNKESDVDADNEITAIFCRPSYYEQDVEATVDSMTGAPTDVNVIGERRPISLDLFNSTVFEDTLASGERQIQTRQDSLPGITIPRHPEDLYDMDLTPAVFATPPIMTTVMSHAKDGLPDLLDSEKLGQAYETVYGLFFARAMTDILRPDFTAAEAIITAGQLHSRTEAVVLEPVFVYLVESLLGVVSLAILVLIYIGFTERASSRLVDDPASMATTMSMAADDEALVDKFADLDCAPEQYFNQKLSASTYKFGNASSNHCITAVELSSEAQRPLLASSYSNSDKKHAHQLPKPIRPIEFHAATAFPFIGLFMALTIILAIFFALAKPNGLPLPSKNPIVQNLVTDYLPTAIAMFIEPMWIVINRLLCILQPLEQMRGAGAAASQSIALNYGSLPPQLTLFKAAKNKHYLLAAVCAMSLLANLLATAFAGLFFHSTTLLPHPTMSSPPFESKFVDINSTSGPPIETSPYYNDPIAISGAYRNSAGESHFLLSESNLTRNTSLPSWTDETAMYIPFKTSESAGTAADETYRARTKYFTADPRCKPLSFDKDFHMHLWPFAREDPFNSFNVTVVSSNATETTCYGADNNRFINNYGLHSMWQMGASGGMSCRNGRTAAEMATTLVAGPNATDHEQETCRAAVAIGWMRTNQKYCDRKPPESKDWKKPRFQGFEDADNQNTFFMLCQPEVRVGEASVLVDGAGVLQEPAEDHTPDPSQDPEALAPYFSNGASNLISQSNLFMFRTLKPWWHNDTFASEFIHYFIHRASPSLHLADPSAALPTFADVDAPMKKAYTRLFAIWLGINKAHLFVPATPSTAQVPQITLKPSERIFFVTPLFAISIAILAVYIVVSTLVYLRRPGRYLARLPTSLAAIIALFASSSALTDLRGTSALTNAERERYLDRLACRYGYGSYVGGDGAVHVGVEKAPFVTHMEVVRFVGSRAARAVGRQGDADGVGDAGKGRGRGYKSVSSTTVESETAYEHLPLEDMDVNERSGGYGGGGR